MLSIALVSVAFITVQTAMQIRNERRAKEADLVKPSQDEFSCGRELQKAGVGDDGRVDNVLDPDSSVLAAPFTSNALQVTLGKPLFQVIMGLCGLLTTTDAPHSR